MHRHPYRCPPRREQPPKRRVHGGLLVTVILIAWIVLGSEAVVGWRLGLLVAFLELLILVALVELPDD